MRLTAALAAILACAAAARAAEPEPPPAEEGFGPEVEIETITVAGNARTAEKLVRRALVVHEGDRLPAGDPRFLASRYRVLALGYFRDVKLRLDKGSRRGAVALTVTVEERGTVTLNRVFLGTSDYTPIWVGLDVGDANLFGSGVAVAVAGVWADSGDTPGARDQMALRLGVADPSVLGSPFGVRATASFARASEPTGAEARSYDRAGGTLGVTWDVTRLSTLSLDVRQEFVDAHDPPPLELDPGESRVGTIAVSLDLDNRPDPILPYRGSELLVGVEAGGLILGDYDYFRVMARAGHWLELAHRHVGAVVVAAGLAGGEVPLFDRFYVGDLNSLLTPRALDLVVSTRASPDFFDSGISRLSYGRLFTSVTLEYAYQLFRKPRTVYGGDLFAQVGVFGLGETDDLRFDFTFNVGLRLDTLIGVFELSLGNALGRIPY